MNSTKSNLNNVFSSKRGFFIDSELLAKKIFNNSDRSVKKKKKKIYNTIIDNKKIFNININFNNKESVSKVKKIKIKKMTSPNMNYLKVKKKPKKNIKSDRKIVFNNKNNSKIIKNSIYSNNSKSTSNLILKTNIYMYNIYSKNSNYDLKKKTSSKAPASKTSINYNIKNLNTSKSPEWKKNRFNNLINLCSLKNYLNKDKNLIENRKKINEKLNDFNELNQNILNNIRYDIYKNYTFKRIIGKGNFGEVRLIYDWINKNYRAAKILNKYTSLNKKIVNTFYNEKKIFLNLDFRYIIKYYDFHENIERIFLILEYFKSVDLNIFLKKSRPLNQLIVIVKKIALTIEYLHTNNIVHRDIKLENILINNELDIRLIDFGFSYITTSLDISNISIFCGTPLYIPPEVINNTLGDKRSDIWSFGVLLYRIIYNNFPFIDKSSKNVYKKILNNNFIFPKNHKNFSKIINKIIKNCWLKDPKKRYKIDKIINLLNEI